ncbi:MAG: hypothetical protein G01um10143_8 [Parcubacteria group bacterium Gr01-1014_3]|nr:MAG: hypothetical protein G01um10143_8 [Parcubacteria group bacterium Gr01-1014_3]
MDLNAKFSPKGRVEAWLFTIFLIIGLIAFAIFEFNYVGRFYPNVFIGSQYVGGLTFAEVLEKLQQDDQLLSAKGISIEVQTKNGPRAIKLPRFAQGLTSDSVVEYFSADNWQKVLFESYAYGRTGSISSRFWDHLKSQMIWHKFPLPVVLQESAVNSLLDRELGLILTEPEPARFVNTKSGVQINAEKIGEEVDRKHLIGKIEESLQEFGAQTISVEAQPISHELTARKLQPFLENAKKVKQNMAIRLTYNGYRWNISGTTLFGWLIPKTKGLGINPAELKNFLNKNIAPYIENPPQNSRFAMNGGKLAEIAPGKSGDSINLPEIELSIDGLIKTAAKGPTIIPIPIIVAQPKITKETIAQFQIKELIANAKTNMSGSSADRRHNIKNGISKLNGVLIAPGEEFSAVRAIGTTTEENGFVKEFVIKEDKSVKELGGGLCQVSTTLFRLALASGLPITERQAHRYVVGYYGPGLDATIYGPYPDLRFINDTGHYLLVQGRVEGDNVMLEFYGQKDGRSSFISEPELSEEKPAPDTKYAISADLPFGTQQCSETPRKGVTAEVTYKVAYPSGETKEQVFKSVYQPWQKICLIGTNKQLTVTR